MFHKHYFKKDIEKLVTLFLTTRYLKHTAYTITHVKQYTNPQQSFSKLLLLKFKYSYKFMPMPGAVLGTPLTSVARKQTQFWPTSPGWKKARNKRNPHWHGIKHISISPNDEWRFFFKDLVFLFMNSGLVEPLLTYSTMGAMTT